jgi:hypothetical protein
MKKMLLALAAMAALGGSTLALTTDTEAGTCPVPCGPCSPEECVPCEACPLR